MSEEIKEIVDKLSNRKQETLIQGLRECQLKDIEHPFITKEEYINKLLNYITSLQQKVEQLEKENKELRQPQVFIDCEDMEERYGRDLYEDYLKGKIEQLENIRKEAIEFCKKYDFILKWQILDILNKGSE